MYSLYVTPISFKALIKIELAGETEAAKNLAKIITIAPNKSVFREIASKTGLMDRNKGKAKDSTKKQIKRSEKKMLNKAKTFACLVTFSDKRKFLSLSVIPDS